MCEEDTNIEKESMAVINLFGVSRYQECPHSWSKWSPEDLTLVEIEDGYSLTINIPFDKFDAIFCKFLKSQQNTIDIHLKAN